MIEFIQQWQGFIVALLGAPFATLMFKWMREMRRASRLRDIEIDSIHYASSRVNSKHKDYTEEWLRHYNDRKKYLIEKYNFIET